MLLFPLYPDDNELRELTILQVRDHAKRKVERCTTIRMMCLCMSILYYVQYSRMYNMTPRSRFGLMVPL